jgi:predicted nucleic acid-binding protein
MVLVDTSVWVDHFRQGLPLLEDLLRTGQMVTHPFVIGELACGNLRNRAEILTLLASLPAIQVATHAEALHLVDAHALHGTGIGWVDAHLLASALLDGASLWTRDRRLREAARTVGVEQQEE